MACRVPGCIADGADAPMRVSRVYLHGICRLHQSLPDYELLTLLNRAVGLVAPLQPIATGIEYERADGTRYGYRHDGTYYEAKP